MLKASKGRRHTYFWECPQAKEFWHSVKQFIAAMTGVSLAGTQQHIYYMMLLYLLKNNIETLLKHSLNATKAYVPAFMETASHQQPISTHMQLQSSHLIPFL